MNVRRGVLTVLMLMLVLACAGLTPSPPPSTDYIGVWSAPGVTLEVRADGTVEYERNSAPGSFRYSGPVSDWSGGKMVYLMGESTVDSAPARGDDGAWTITVDGVELTRQ